MTSRLDGENSLGSAPKTAFGGPLNVYPVITS